MKHIHVRGSTLLILSYICFSAFLLKVSFELAQGNEFDAFYLVILFMGLLLFVIGKWKSRRDQDS